jgi:AraC-like DNA-binding protein
MSANSNDRGTIAVCFVQEALEGVRARGFDTDSLLRASGIPPELIQSPQARISSSNYGKLWHRIADATDDEFFGMDSRRMKAGSFTLLCHSVIHADTLERALLRALRFLRLVMDDIEGHLVRKGKDARIELVDHAQAPQHSSGMAAPPNRAFAYGTYLLMLHGLACWLVGRRIPLSCASFRAPEPQFSSEWKVLFCSNLNFDQPWSGICFDSEYLDMGNIQNERTMKEFLRGAPMNFLVKYKNSASLTAKIRRHLRTTHPADWPDFGTLADQLHYSKPTLRRRLEDEGSTYRAILDDLRRDMAISLLSDSGKSITAVANALGFADPSAFHRAFRKWTGARPGQYRELAGAEKPARD